MQLIKETIEFIGEHPLSTGVLAILGIVGFVISVAGFQFDRSDAKSSTDAQEEIKKSLNKLETLVEPTKPQIPIIADKSYPEARKLLIEHGWIPHLHHPSIFQETNSGQMNGNSRDLWDHGYRENDFCYGTGDGGCRFVYTNTENEILVITTWGESFDGDFSRVKVKGIFHNPGDIYPPTRFF